MGAIYENTFDAVLKEDANLLDDVYYGILWTYVEKVLHPTSGVFTVKPAIYIITSNFSP